MDEGSRNPDVLVQLLHTGAEIGAQQCQRMWAQAIKSRHNKMLEALARNYPQWAPWETLDLDQLPLHAAQLCLKSSAVDLATAAKAAFASGNIDHIYALALREDCDEQTMRTVLRETQRLDKTATTAFFLLRTGKVPADQVVATAARLIDNWPDQGTLDSHYRSDSLIQTLSAALSEHVGPDESLWQELVRQRPLPPVLAAVLQSCTSPGEELIESLATQMDGQTTWGSIENKIVLLILTRPSMTEQTWKLVKNWSYSGRLRNVSESEELVDWHSTVQEQGKLVWHSLNPTQRLKLAVERSPVDVTGLLVEALIHSEDVHDVLLHAQRASVTVQVQVTAQLVKMGKTQLALLLMTAPEVCSGDIAEEFAKLVCEDEWLSTLANEISQHGNYPQSSLQHLVRTKRFGGNPVMTDAIPLPVLIEANLAGAACANHLRQLDSYQKDVFLQLLPRWHGSLRQLTAVVRDATQPHALNSPGDTQR